MNPDISRLSALIQSESTFIQHIQEEISSVVVGQSKMIEKIILGLLTGGHVLLEGLPGLAKTLTIKSVAEVLDVNFKRVQFTPDLLPSDLTGTMIFNPKTGEFSPKKGPVFTNILLADEINRAPAKVQAALLECMGEKQVTIGEETHKLSEPFIVLATQNPIEQEGTYPLPEAQMDRFMFKVNIGYPNRTEEKKILELQSGAPTKDLKPQASIAQILKARSLVNEIFIDEKIKDYILDIVFATRNPEEFKLEDMKELITVGASPRATLSLARAARARAFMEGRGFTTPDDVKSVAVDILQHRLVRSFEAEAREIDSAQIVQKVLSTIPSP